MKKFKQLEKDDNGKFVLYENETEIGEIHYKRQDNDTIIAMHTEVGKNHGNKGYGIELIDKLAEFARNSGLKIIPECSYVKKVFERNTNYSDVKKEG